MAHFAKKHYSEGIFTSAYQHLLSHLEFGGCLADYSGLNKRYNRLRQLEDIDELSEGGANMRKGPRVRFVNYYTVSTGIPKTPPPPKRADTHLRPIPPPSYHSPAGNSGASTPMISIDDYSDAESVQHLQLLDPVPEPDSDFEEKPKPQEPESTAEIDNGVGPSTHEIGSDPTAKDSAAPASEPHASVDDPNDLENGLPAIPPLPESPEAPDFDRYTDKDARKQAEKEFKRVQKTYEQAVKNRDKAVKERQKLVDKRRKKAQKETDKQRKEEEKRIAKEQQQQQKEKEKASKAAAAPKEGGQDEMHDAAAAEPSSSSPPSSSRAQVVTTAQTQALQEQLTDLALQETSSLSPESTHTTDGDGDRDRDRGKQKETNHQNDKNKKEKLGKFCMLPPKANGARDPAWVQVYMEGVDEVGAHCGLFFAGPHYEKLVGDVGGRMVGWVQDDLTKRAILAMG